MSLRIKKGDMVVVVSGGYRGVRGRVLSIQTGKEKAIVEGVRMAKHHRKARSQGEPGGIHEKEAAIPLCKLMLAEPGSNGRAARFGVKLDKDGNKVRVLKLGKNAKEVTV